MGPTASYALRHSYSTHSTTHGTHTAHASMRPPACPHIEGYPPRESRNPISVLPSSHVEGIHRERAFRWKDFFASGAGE